MILLYPLLLVFAAAIVWRRRGTPTAEGWRWFGAWCLAGALLTFSLLTGLSIGLLVLPFAAFALLYTARRAHDLREALGFLAGVGVAGGIVWPPLGALLAAVALVAYWAARERAVTPTP